MDKRDYNFTAGPGVLPESVLREAQQDIWNFRGTGLGIMETSHRSNTFLQLLADTFTIAKKLLNLPDTHEVLLVPAGATLQFSMVALNLCQPGQVANYLIGGYWADKAYQEGARLVSTHIAGTSAQSNYTTLPTVEDLSANAAYLHYTSNNTIMGTQHKEEPHAGSIPLVCDVSSDILSKPIDISRYGLIYACAQKNLGIAGITLVVIRKDLLARSPKNLPILLDYNTYFESGSLYNTIPTFPVYIVNRVMHWIDASGGPVAMQKHNESKAAILYDAIDEFPNFYRGHATREARSLMNASFFTPTPALDERFIAEAKEHGLKGLAGHKVIGGMRVSMYNACTKEAVEALASFVRDFARKNS